MRSVLLGAVADDVTGATDLGSMLRRNGMDVIQLLGLRGTESAEGLEADAIVCALRTRTAPREQPVAADRRPGA